MSVDCNAVARNCLSCGNIHVTFCLNIKRIHLHSATTLLEIIPIDILGKVLATKQKNRFPNEDH